MDKVTKSLEDALKDVHTFLNHPMKAGRLYTTYEKEPMKSALKVLADVIYKLENK